MSARSFSLLLAFGLVQVCFASDWLRFRGPNGSGISPDKNPAPATWSAAENLKWNVPLPGPGSSSPIVVGDRVYVTCYSGYATDPQNPGSQQNLKRHLLCLDRRTGKTNWLKTIDPVLPEDEFSGMGMPQHGYASHTPVSDGERVYVFFGKTGAMAFDKDGNQLWRTQVGAESDPRRWGSASSPILYNNLLIVTAPAESEALLALDKETGRQVWRKEARGFSNTWGSPILVQVDGSRADLVLGVPYEIWGFDPRTGKLQWYCEAMQTDTFCSSAIAEDGVVYAIEGLRGGSIAVRAGGAGDVRDTHVVWTGRDNNRIATPILFEGRIYFFSNRIANCISAKTGERIYQERLSGGSSSSAVRGQGGGRFGRFGGMGGQDYASPVIADGKIFYTTRSGTVYVIKSGPDFAQLAANQMTNDVEDFSATPAVSDGELFLRSSKRLYCVAQGKSAP